MKSNMMNMKTFNPESDSLDARTYGLKGADDQYNLQILAFLTKMLPQYQQLVMSQSKNIINTVTRRAMEISIWKSLVILYLNLFLIIVQI